MGHFLHGLQAQGSQPWPRLQHCPWTRKIPPKRKPVTDEPHGLPSHPHSHARLHPGLCTQPGGEKPLPLGLLMAMIQGLEAEAGGCEGLHIGPSVCPQVGVGPCAGPSDLGLQHLQEEFVHGHLALQFDAVEMLHGLGGCLPQQGQCQQQLARPPWLLVALA